MTALEREICHPKIAGNAIIEKADRLQTIRFLLLIIATCVTRRSTCSATF